MNIIRTIVLKLFLSTFWISLKGKRAGKIQIDFPPLDSLHTKICLISF